jgi:signal transduction histidine kinase
MSIPPRNAEATAAPAPGKEPSYRDPTRGSREAEFQAALYEAILYGLARTLSLYDPASVRLLVREMGRRIREYLEDVGYHLGSASTPDETVVRVASFFVEHGFVDLEIVDWEADVIHARWHHLLGLRAYERIAAAGGATFVSCPLNAVLHDSLAVFGKELSLREKHFDVDQQFAESWEEIVEMGPEISPLSLDAKQLLELEREQSRQLRVRDEFIRIASHELSTPLTSTKLALKRLEGMQLPGAAARSVAVMKRQVRRLEQLVTDMLDTTRLQIGRLKLERAPVDLVELVLRVIDSLASGDPRETPEIELRYEASPVGRWDAARLDQVVTNLLTNAIKYGEGRPIDVGVSADDGHARLTVQDRGIGIPPEAIERIFEPFERAVPVETHGGLGLGLYIARRVVEMHGGRISAESVLGEGTTFTVLLPLESSQQGNVIVELPLEQRETAT